MNRGLGPGGVWGVEPPLESGIYIVKKFLKTFLIYWDPPWIKIVPWPLTISMDKSLKKFVFLDEYHRKTITIDYSS